MRGNDMNRYEKNFAYNIRKLRKEANMKQSDLADAVGYSEKTISKWETGPSIPSVQALIKIARILNTSIDALFADSENIYFLGIDGGGSKTDFELSDILGKTICFYSSDCSNPFDIGMDKAKGILREGIFKVLGNIAPCDTVLFAGLAGGTTGNNKEIFHKFFSDFGFRALENGSDNENIISAGLGKTDGITLVMGTGICAYTVKKGIFTRVAGWGYLLDDGGSGFNIGRDAVASACRAYDGSGEKTILSQLIIDMTGSDLPSLIHTIYEKGKKYIASFAPIVFKAAEADDVIAKGIIEKNMKAAAHILNTAASNFSGNVKVVLAGGLTKYPMTKEYLMPYITDSDRLSISILDVEPVKGAVQKAHMLWEARK